MPYQSPGPPPFNVMLTMHWPYNPFATWDPTDDTNVTGEFESWVVPTSRLNVLGHLGASHRFESEFKMPICTHYIETPSYSDNQIYGCSLPYMIGQGPALTDAPIWPSWDVDLASGATIMQDPEQPFDWSYLVLWTERRWWGQDEFWIRSYVMAYFWYALNPLPTPPPARLEELAQVQAVKRAAMTRAKERQRLTERKVILPGRHKSGMPLIERR